MVELTDKILFKAQFWQSNTLYIASPVTQIKVTLHMKRALEERFNRRVFTTVDTLKFLRTKYAACNPKTLDYDLHDLLSLRPVFYIHYVMRNLLRNGNLSHLYILP